MQWVKSCLGNAQLLVKYRPVAPSTPPPPGDYKVPISCGWPPVASAKTLKPDPTSRQF